MSLKETLQQGIEAAQAGHKQAARLRLTEVVETDESQLEAWLWLSQIVDSLEEAVRVGPRLWADGHVGYGCAPLASGR